jgi:hypothetical protein
MVNTTVDRSIGFYTVFVKYLLAKCLLNKIHETLLKSTSFGQKTFGQLARAYQCFVGTAMTMTFGQ